MHLSISPMFIPSQTHRSLFRAMIKAGISLLTPVLMILVTTNQGRTKYEQITRSLVVHVNFIYRPVFSISNAQ